MQVVFAALFSIMNCVITCVFGYSVIMVWELGLVWYYCQFCMFLCLVMAVEICHDDRRLGSCD